MFYRISGYCDLAIVTCKLTTHFVSEAVASTPATHCYLKKYEALNAGVT